RDARSAGNREGSGRLEVHGTPTTSTPGTTSTGPEPSRTTTAPLSSAGEKSLHRNTDDTSSGSWFPGNTSTGTGNADNASTARRTTERGTALSSKTSPATTTNCAPWSAARAPSSSTAASLSAVKTACDSSPRNRRVI